MTLILDIAHVIKVIALDYVELAFDRLDRIAHKEATR